MKILIIGPFPPTINGVTISNDFLRCWLVQAGDKVKCINTETGDISTEQGKKGRIRKAFRFLWLYRNLFKINGSDVVYITIGQTFFGIMKYFPFMFWSKCVGVPYVLHVHGGYIKDSYKSMVSWQKEWVDYIITRSKSLITLSESLKHQVKSVFPSANITVVENFYDQRLLDIERQERGSQPIRFLYLSNLMIGKGIQEFLDALILLKQRNIPFTVSLAGGLEKGLDAVIQHKLDLLKDRITFYGLANFEKKRDLLYNSDIFVLPTWYLMEGQPLSIIEAYVTGNVVVSTDQGGIPDISGYSTFVSCPKQDSIGLAQKLDEIIFQYQTVSLEIKETMKLTRERFHPDRFGKEVRGVFSNQSNNSQN